MNRLFLLLFGAVSLVAHAQVPDYVPTEGLMAWYALDGDGTDDSDNQLHAATTATQPTENRSGEANAALAFGSAAGSTTSHVTIPGLVSDVVNTFSYSFWANPLMNIFLPNQGGTGNEGVTYNTSCILHPLHGHFFGTDSLHAGAGVHLGQNGIVVGEHSDAFVAATLVEEAELSGWNHYVIVYTEGIPSLFINGEFVKSGVATTRETHISLGTDPWYPTGGIGNGYNDLTFNGSIDDFGFWSRALNSIEVAGLYSNQVQVLGCTDSVACNFNEAANQDDSSCIYPLFGDDCETGGAACGEGTIWDSASQSCVAWNDCPSDLNGDGSIGVNDLMELLSAFGTDCPEPEEPATTEFTCGDPVSYHGYDYATVQIGEQCWFAENLRTELYSNGDSIPHLIDCDSWSSAPNGAYCHYDNEPDSTNSSGLLYNWFATNFPNGICPSEWHVPSDAEWMTLEMELGMSESEANSTYWRGTDEGSDVKSNLNWNGSNTSGFGAIPGGTRGPYNGCEFAAIEYGTWYWTSTGNGSLAVGRGLTTEESRIVRMTSYQLRNGFSVRCIKD